MRIAFLLRLLVVLGMGGLIAGCGLGFDMDDLLTPQDGSMRVNRLIGPPKGVSNRMMTVIGAKAEAEGLPVVVGGRADTNYELAGYMSAASETDGTDVAYVFDVLDNDGDRQHRLTGVFTAKTSPGDPWKAVDNTVVDAIAERVVADLKTWYGNDGPSARQPGTPETASDTPSDAPPEPPARPNTTNGAALSGQNPALALLAPPRPPAAIVAATEASTTLPQPITIALTSIDGAPGDGSTSLSNAVDQALEPYGIDLVPDPEKARYRLAADVSITPPEKGRQAVAIIWTVSDKAGAIGSVRQINAIPSGSLETQWGGSAQSAAASAANGIATLVQPNPVK